MLGPTLVDTLREQFGDGITEVDLEAIDPWIGVAPAALVPVCEFLKSHEQLQFDMLNCISAVDYFHSDEKKAKKAGWDPHIEVVYHLSSTKVNPATELKHWLVLKVSLPRWKDDVEGQLPEVPSVAHLWRTADWHEREVFDLSGVHFSGHPDLRRILCPEDWVGYPLRKDYEMPLDYHGIRGR